MMLKAQNTETHKTNGVIHSYEEQSYPCVYKCWGVILKHIRTQQAVCHNYEDVLLFTPKKQPCEYNPS